MNLERRERGGEGGIRTLEGPFEALTPLAGERFRPLSHLSDVRAPTIVRRCDSSGCEPDSRRAEANLRRPARIRLRSWIFPSRLATAEEKLPRGPHRLRLPRLLVSLLAFDPFVDFFAVHSDFSRGVHAQAHLISLHAQDGHGDVVADDHRLPHSPGQDQHSQTPSWSLLPIPRSHSCTT